MELLEDIRPWIVPIIVLASFVLMLTGKLRDRWLGHIESEIAEIKSDIKLLRSDVKSEHQVLHGAFTKHLIELHGNTIQSGRIDDSPQ